MTGQKMARIRKCHECQYRVTHHAKRAPWPFCIYRGYEGRIELSDRYMEGPDSNCPAGYWAGLEPLDLEAERKEREERRKERIRVSWKPMLSRCLSAVRARSRARAAETLVELVEQDGLPDWLALELKDELGLE